MALYITRCALEVNGTVETNFKRFAENARVLRKAVPLMYKTGTAKLTQRFALELDYVVPQTNPFNFDNIEAGTITVEYDNGDRVNFGGVSTAEVGDGSVDGENELVKKISFIAETKDGSTGA